MSRIINECSMTIISYKDLERLTGKSRSTLARWVSNKTLTPPLKLSSHSVGWRLSDIKEWIDGLEASK